LRLWAWITSVETVCFASQSAPGAAYEPGRSEQRNQRQSEQELPEVVHEKAGGRIAERLQSISGHAYGSQYADPLARQELGFPSALQCLWPAFAGYALELRVELR
jgi:hypothetical protein